MRASMKIRARTHSDSGLFEDKARVKGLEFGRVLA